MLRQQSQVWGMLASERWIAAQNAIQTGFQHEQTEAHPLSGALMTLRKEGYKDFLWGNISVTIIFQYYCNHSLKTLKIVDRIMTSTRGPCPHHTRLPCQKELNRCDYAKDVEMETLTWIAQLGPG